MLATPVEAAKGAQGACGTGLGHPADDLGTSGRGGTCSARQCPGGNPWAGAWGVVSSFSPCGLTLQHGHRTETFCLGTKLVKRVAG